MLSVAMTQSLVTIISLFCAYIVSVTITGAGQAWIAHKMGDSTAEDAGFLSLNPLDHADSVGFIALMFFGVGWGRQIPIDVDSIKPKHRLARLLLVLSTEALLSLILAFISLVILILKFGSYSFILAFEMFLSGNVPVRTFADILPDTSSLMISFSLLLFAMIFFNVLIATVSAIMNGVRFALLVGIEKGYKYAEYADYFTFIVPLIVLLLFADPLRVILMKGVMYCAYGLGYILGAL